MPRRHKGGDTSFDSRLRRQGHALEMTDHLLGAHVGIAENTSDPLGLGRVQVRVFGIHGTPERVPTELLPWATPCFPLRGSFTVPEVEDRVVVVFEGGDRYKPMWLGYWYAIPTGRGTQHPHNIRQGTEVPQDAWQHDRGKPQVQLIGKTAEGSAISMQETTIGGTLQSSVVLHDSGGKALILRTLHDLGGDYDPFAGDKGHTPASNPTVRLSGFIEGALNAVQAGEVSLGIGPSVLRKWRSLSGVAVEAEEVMSAGSVVPLLRRLQVMVPGANLTNGLGMVVETLGSPVQAIRTFLSGQLDLPFLTLPRAWAEFALADAIDDVTPTPTPRPPQVIAAVTDVLGVAADLDMEA